MPVISTSDARLDSVIGGLKHPGLIVLVGKTGTGKTVISEYIAYGAIEGPQREVGTEKMNYMTNCNIDYFSLDKSIKATLDHMESIGIEDANRIFSTGKLRIFSPMEARTGTSQVEQVSEEDVLQNIYQFSKNDYSDLVVIDSITSLTHRLEYKTVNDIIAGMRGIVEQNNKSIVITFRLSLDEIGDNIEDLASVLVNLKKEEVAGRKSPIIEIVKGESLGTSISWTVSREFGLKMVSIGKTG